LLNSKKNPDAFGTKGKGHITGGSFLENKSFLGGSQIGNEVSSRQRTVTNSKKRGTLNASVFVAPVDPNATSTINPNPLPPSDRRTRGKSIYNQLVNTPLEAKK